MQSLEYFRQFAPLFNKLDDEAATKWITSALPFIEDSKTLVEGTEKKKLAIALFAAHLAWLNEYQGQGGGHRGLIKSEKDDTLSKEYIAIQDADTWLGQSSYGMQFKNLTKSRPVPSILTALS